MTRAGERKITIKDVAHAAGMSLGTTSGILNGATGFSEETKKKIWLAASELNYHPNPQARGLRSGGGQAKRQNSGIIIHITHMADENLTLSEPGAMRSAILSLEGEKMGLYPITYMYYKLKGFQCPPVLNGHIDGAIVGTPHVEIVKTLKDRLPLVLMDVPFSLENSNIPVVNINFREGFARLFDLLKKNGHRKIGTLSVSAANPHDELMNETVIHNEILSSAKTAGIEIHSESDLPIRVTPEIHDREMRAAATRFAKHIRDGNISAIVSPNSSYTESLFAIFGEMGIKVPENVSLAGVEHRIKAPEFNITSITYDWTGMIKTSLEALKNLIDGKNMTCCEFLVRPGFYEGKTVGKIRQG